MTLDEGYIKYESDWTKTMAPDVAAVRQLEKWRAPLYAATLIGHYKELNVGYGNISLRCRQPRQFLITGTQTGHIEHTDEQHYALVTAYNIDGNTVSCAGPIQASSEAMTHAAIYELDEAIGAIVHVHNAALWQRHLHNMPTTDENVAYGTPQMAQEFRRLYDETDFAALGIAVMAGHEEGLISIGQTIEQAAVKILDLYSLA